MKSKLIFLKILFILLFITSSYLVYSPQHALAVSSTCGNTGSRSSTDSGDVNFSLAIPDCVPASNSTVQSCAIGVSSAAGNISCAVYANSGSAPTGAPLCQSADTLAVTGLNTLPLSGCGTLSAGTPYWIVVSTNNNSLAYIRTGDSSATDKFQSGTYPTFPTGGTWGTLGAFSYQFYLNLSTGGGGSDTIAPSVPTNLTATAISQSQINLSWTASTDNVGVTGYTIYRGGVQIGTSATNSYSDTGLSASTLYSYTVSAQDAAGNTSAQSVGAGVTTQATVITPPPGNGSLLYGLLDPSRAINWAAINPGVIGGIPNRTTICSTLSPGATSAQINAAITSCPSGDVVFLNAGTYTIASGINFGNHSNVTLRGAGPLQTILKFTGPDGCGGLSSDVCVQNAIPLYDGSPATQPGGSNAATWSGGYTQGSTQITLTNVGSSPPHVGDILMLDQANDTTDNGGLIECDSQPNCSVNGGAFGRSINGVHYSQIQAVRITAISGNTYSITPGIYANNIRSSQNPGAWWSNNPIINVGVENMTLDHTASSDTSGINFYNCYDCWAKNIRGLNSGRNQVYMTQSAHVEIRDSYFYASAGGAEGVYGIEPGETSDDLVENNIFDQVAAPLVFSQASGMVVAYNYNWDPIFSASATWMSTVTIHDTGSFMNLFEGNYFNGISSDNQHGSAPLTTLFRNWLPGQLPPPNSKTGGTWALEVEPPGARGWNLLGNVLGYAGYHTGYETAPALGQAVLGCNNYILSMGWSNVGCQSTNSPGNDPLVMSTMYRWGNYDTVDNAIRWDTSEVPTVGVPFINAQAIPATQTLPASLYLSAKPIWWGANIPWPAIGPDVTGGNVSGVAGHANLIPAAVCYNSTSKDTNGVLNFDANTCYYSGGSGGSGGGDTQAPTVPVSLSASASSQTTVSLTWSPSIDNVGVTGYNIYRGGVQIGTSATNSYSDSGLSASTQYTYTVSAYDAAGNTSAQSSSASATTQSGTPVPGDLNSDHIVNSLDFSLLNSKWGQNYPAYDLYPDGIINSLDYAIMSANWGKTW